jgi:hypothetical protein
MYLWSVVLELILWRVHGARASSPGHGLAGWFVVTRESSKLSRRRILRAGALGVVAVPLAAACSKGYDEGPDPLVPLLEQAMSDAAAATTLAGSSPKDADAAKQVADARTAHAEALRSEVDRLNRPKASNSPVSPASFGPDLAGLKQRLADARKQAEGMVGAQPRYRASLLASIAAGCAGLQRIAPGLDVEETAAALDAPTSATLPAESVDALQQALAAEHAAIWTYGLVSAYLPADVAKAATDGSAEHVKRRDFCERVLTAAGGTPVSPEAAYVPPKPVTDAASAKAVVATAESDTTTAWRGVVGRTDDAGLRTTATRALIASVRRGTPWRMEAGEKPAAVALP